MSVPDRSIDPKIIASAKKEFLTNGFEQTSLKTICDNAGITTGALYKRFKGKEDLFHALVVNTVEDLNEILQEKGNADVTALSDSQLIEAWNMDVDYMMWWFRFLYERHDEFVLLLRSSEGTSYSNFQHNWVEQMTIFTNRYLQETQKRGLTKTIVSLEELHVLLSAFWTTIYEPFIHDFSWEQIENHCSVVCRLFNWYEALTFHIKN